jgi:hypothetical protein
MRLKESKHEALGVVAHPGQPNRVPLAMPIIPKKTRERPALLRLLVVRGGLISTSGLIVEVGGPVETSEESWHRVNDVEPAEHVPDLHAGASARGAAG